MKIKLTKIKCLRCGYEWYPKVEDVRQCAKCHSAHWDKPKPKTEKGIK
jgi:predicted Zn-ribbon and HTH transcriptional regulator